MRFGAQTNFVMNRFNIIWVNIGNRTVWLSESIVSDSDSPF